MIYLSGADNVSWRAYAETDPIGLCATPDIGNTVAALSCYRVWCADNACYAHPHDFDLGRFLAWLAGLDAVRGSCLFANAPDVVGKWDATLQRALPVLPTLREMGHKSAIVLQDECTPSAIPWDEIDAVFVGGTTRWKVGQQSEACCREAKRRGKWVHMGRVNSLKRLNAAAYFGCDSVDGTFIKFGPRVNAKKLIRWLRKVNAQCQLFAA